MVDPFRVTFRVADRGVSEFALFLLGKFPFRIEFARHAPIEDFVPLRPRVARRAHGERVVRLNGDAGVRDEQNRLHLEPRVFVQVSVFRIEAELPRF